MQLVESKIESPRSRQDTSKFIEHDRFIEHSDIRLY